MSVFYFHWRSAAGLFMATTLVGGLAPLGLQAAEEPVSFNRDIRPILSDNCFFCHGPDAGERKAGLRLDVRESALARHKHGAAIVPGDASASELMQRLTAVDPEDRMPPTETGKVLTRSQLEQLRAWIAGGARYEKHWSYTMPERPPLPSVRRTDWADTPVDFFILGRLEKEGLAPSAPANPATLVRRLHLDLVGLPPDPETVAAFEPNPSDASYLKMVNALLASPHFGERLAVHWLDLVRYADTVGYHGDQDHNASAYRDYVIRSFNDNLPFDVFTREQLAGDLLPEPDLWQRIASGYNRLLQTTHEGGAQDKEYRAKYLADRVRNLSGVWLGATMGCAECHDHKYDPFTQRDFYSLGAFFADVEEHGAYPGANSLPTKRPPEIPVWDLEQSIHLRDLERTKARGLAELEAVKGDAGKRAEWEKRIQDLDQEMENVRKHFQPAMITVATEPRTIRVLPRGNWLDDSGPVVTPMVPQFLPPLEAAGRADRLDLANWLMEPANPLTARVFVNRMWKLFFGSGLAASLDDLGAQGEPPVHPELLDWLAVEFRVSGWDIKHLIHLLVTSRTYRQSSLETPALRERDPANRLLARQSRWRLEAEFIRDHALQVSGLLVPRLGGHSVRPYQPTGYYQHLNFPTRTYQADTGSDQYRRGVYTHWQRIFLHPMLKAFDAPSREECTAERPISNTPLAALTLLNDPTFVEAARAFAGRILRQGGADHKSRLHWAWRQTLGRDPQPRELEALTQLLAEEQKHFHTSPRDARALAEVGQDHPSMDLDPVELAAWTSVARAMFNLNETLTRN